MQDFDKMCHNQVLPKFEYIFWLYQLLIAIQNPAEILDLWETYNIIFFKITKLMSVISNLGIFFLA